MLEEKMQDNWPVEGALCVFHAITGFMFLGYMISPKDPVADRVKIYMKGESLSVESVDSYQYVLSSCNGFIFVNPDMGADIVVGCAKDLSKTLESDNLKTLREL